MTHKPALILVLIPAVFAALTGGGAAADSNRAGGPDSALVPSVPVVLTAELTWVDPPYRFGLAGGWTVQLAEPMPLLEDRAAGSAATGPITLKVVGRHRPDGGRLIHAGAVSLVRAPGVHRATAATTQSLVASDDDVKLEGPLVELTVDGFTMTDQGATFQVIVTPDTELEGFSSLSELTPGDIMEARGTLDGTVLTADRVRLESHGGEVERTGTISSLAVDGFVMRSDGDDLTVTVTAATTYVHVGGLGQLKVSDLVEVTGVLVDLHMTASEVELKNGGGGGSGAAGVDFDYKGRLLQTIPPDRFAMDDNRVYRVDGATIYDPRIGSYAGLAAGQYLEVEAVRTSAGDNLALAIEYEGDDDGGQGYVEIEGTVTAVDVGSIEIDGGEPVAILPSTLFTGDADSLDGVVVGWRAEVDALRELTGALSARVVRAEDPAPATTAGQEFEPQQALVVPVAGASGDGIATRFGAEIAGRVGDLAVLLVWPEPIDDGLLAAVTADPEVDAVEPNYLFRDPESVRRRYPTVDRNAVTLKLIDQPAVHHVRMNQAHELSIGVGIVVAVIDTGVDPLHPVLRRHILSDGLDLVDGDASPWESRDGVDSDGDGDIDEAAGHGTFVASLIALAAPGASILPYRVLDDDGGGTAYNLALALADAIQRRVDVINLSLIYNERSTAVDLLLERAASSGIMIVTSAGNDGLDSLPFPASDSHTLPAAALTADAIGLAPFSNRSALVVLAAPGEEIYGGLDEQNFGTSSGTSMAAPWVSATAALLLAVDPGLDPMLVGNILLQSGSPLTDGPWTGVTLDMAAAVETVAAP